MIKNKFIINSWQEEKQVRFVNISFGLGVALIILCISGFYIGFHNVDLSWNILKISYYENINYENFADVYNFKGDTMNYDRGYIIGLDYMRLSFYGIIIGMMLLTYSLTLYPLLLNGEVRKK